jgi:hypothetical protein
VGPDTGLREQLVRERHDVADDERRRRADRSYERGAATSGRRSLS